MVKITFPDGNSREFDKGIKAIEVAKNLSKSLAKTTIAVSVNGKVVDLDYQINDDASIIFYSFSDKEGKNVYWHSSSHIMAYAVMRLFPNVKVAIGPAIDQGFYYDFDSEPFTDEDLRRIEKEISKIIKSGIKFERKEISRKEALDIFEAKGEIYKVELIKELPEGEVISIYTLGDFVDLCRGPHLQNSSKVKHFKLLTSSGAYWRGNSDNTMLQRIYGITFPDKDELEKFLLIRAEAEKRNHKKLGKELNLFSFHEETPGNPFFKNNGLFVFNTLLDYWREEHIKESYTEIKTPIMLKRVLWETSGHWENYSENMFTSEVEDEQYVLKPMNCPGGILMYKEDLHSYREMPIKAGEIGLVHRNEFSGALSGLFRVRSFHQDDAHIYMRKDQIKKEILDVLHLVDRMYSTFGLKYHLELSTRPEKSIGTDEAWENATNGLRDALVEYDMGYELNEGDGAFYGPKIDIMIHDALDRVWQCGTIQLDMNLPERFDINFINENSDKERCVMIHRTIYGSIERFMGILIEHFGGFFPLWLTPVQIAIIPVSDKFNKYAKSVYEKLVSLGFRVDYDDRSEKVGYKIREADGIKKTPYMLVIGEKEEETNIFTVRQHKNGNIGELSLDDFIAKLSNEVETRKLPDGYKLELNK